MSSAVTSSSTSSYLSVEEDDINSDTHTPTLIGSGEYQIVGIRYYKGVAHPGEYIELIREPNNPYDRNAIRVDNLRGDKIGHVKAIMAKLLAPIMDRRQRLGLSFYGLIPRKGNAYTLPLFLEIYFTGRQEQEQEQDQEQTQQAVEVVQKALMVGIPLVSAISAPTSLAIDFAKRGDLTLVGFMRGDKMNIYSGSDRIQ